MADGVGMAETVDDVCCVVRQSGVVVFAYYAVKPLHVGAYFVLNVVQGFGAQ